MRYSLLHGETIDLLLALDSTKGACASNDTLACIGGMFAALDKQPDEKLNNAEH